MPSFTDLKSTNKDSVHLLLESTNGVLSISEHTN